MTEALFALNIPTLRAADNMHHALTAIRGGLFHSPKILLERQVKIVNDILKTIEEGSRAVYVDLPTGSGKTVILTQMLDYIQKGGLYKPKTLIVTDSKNLVQQTKLRFDEFAPDVSVGMYYQAIKQMAEPVIVTTYASLPFFAKNFANEFDYLIWDEAHKVLSDNRINYMQKFNNAVMIALTATPAYSDDKDLAQYFTLASRMTVPEAIEDGLICGYRNILVECEYADMDSVTLSNSGEFDEVSLAKAINIYSRNRAAVDFYMNEFDPYSGMPLLGKRAISNCITVQHAYDSAKVFNDLISPNMVGGMTPCVPIHGESIDHYAMSEKRKKEILEAHQNGEIAILSNANLLIHGHDDPGIELVLNLAPTRSLVRVLQRARNLRVDKYNPFKTALIADFVDKTSHENKKSLIYGEVVGQGSYILPEIERTYRRLTSEEITHPVHNPHYFPIDYDWAKKHKVVWSATEINSYINESLKIRRQDHKTNWKQDDDLSAKDIAQKLRVSGSKIRNIFYNILENIEGEEDLWFDPDNRYDRDGNAITYQMSVKRHVNAYILCLKEKDYKKFVANYFPKLPKQENEYSASDLKNIFHVKKNGIDEILERCVPCIIKEKEGLPLDAEQDILYYDPVEEAKYPGRKAVTFRITERASNGHEYRCINNEDIKKFGEIYYSYTQKQEGELSANTLAELYDAAPKSVRTILNRLIPYQDPKQQKGGEEETLYIDPVEEEKYPGREPVTFQIATRRTNAKKKDIEASSATARYLKEADKDKFHEIYFPYDLIKEDEISFVDVANRLNTTPEAIKDMAKSFALAPGEKDLWFDPSAEKDCTGNPVTFFMCMRRSGRSGVYCIKEVDFDKFSKICFPYDLKKDDELSANEVAKQLETVPEPIKEIFQRFVPFEENSGINKESTVDNQIMTSQHKEGLYIDPVEEAKHPGRDPIAFHIAMRRTPPTISYCIKKDEFDKFRLSYFPHELKKENEVSAYDVKKILEVSFKTASNIIKRFEPSPDQKNMWFDPKVKKISGETVLLPIVTRRGSQGEIKCFDKSYMEVFAKQYGFKYRPEAPEPRLRQLRKKDELSVQAIGDKVGAGKRTILDIIERFVPLETSRDQVQDNGDPDRNIPYIDPLEEAKHPGREPVVFHFSKRQSGTNKDAFCLMDYDFASFQIAYFPTLPKRENELSPQEISRILKISSLKVEAILNRLQLMQVQQDMWTDPELEADKQTPLNVVTRRTSGNPHFKCLAENCLDIFSKQYNCPYRNSNLNKKMKNI